ncbi:MAG: hypothetical protein ACE5KE_06255, partial [Methanosarcinales archaeon]
MDLENIAGGHDKNKINLEFLLNLLKKKKFTGFISIENGEVIMMNGRICYSQYKNHFGENALYIVKEKIATPREVVVKR